MKKKVIGFMLALVVSVVGIVGFAGMAEASEYGRNGSGCYEDFQPFDLGKQHGD